MEKQKQQIEVISLDEIKPIGNSWSKARDLEDSGKIKNIELEQIYNDALKIKDYRDRALFVLAYFTAGRISEIVRYQKIKWGKKQVVIVQVGKRPKKKWIQDYKQRNKIGDIATGIRKCDIKYEIIKNVPCVIVRLRVLKNKKEHFKDIPIKLDTEINKKLWQIVTTYEVTIQYEYQELFPFSKRNAERILAKIGYNPHSLRKIRLTHLVRYEHFDDQRLKLYAGWTDSRPASAYIKLKYEDLV